MNSLAARKQALVVESELYRQSLAREFAILNRASVQLRRGVKFLRWLRPILLVAPIVGSIIGFGSRPQKTPSRGWGKWWGLALGGWRLYRRALSFLNHFAAKRNSPARSVRTRFRELTL